ncbi:helix-turn-helix domain-containing protein [Streptomyces sp. B29(2018)]|uniref:helix-turn-helix domain-containing protein n=1 Tax=Streptomyces sp. B29(2018) TaxID=2485016 RepID=UPI000FD67EDE|nr:helix-turn-helix domain-containing protein [Streptomyces sp. B29(2018)]
MIETVFRSEDVPAGDRFDRWRELMRQCTAPLELDSEYREDFQASQRLLDLDGIVVWPTKFQPVRFRRTAKLIRQSDPEQVNISIPVDGTLYVIRDGHEMAYGPQTLCVVDSSREIEVRTTAHQVGIGFDVPKALLPLSGDGIERLCRYRLSGREGFGALLTSFLSQIAKDTTSYQKTDGGKLAKIAVDLLSALITHHLGTDDVISPDSHRRILAMRVRQFIRQNASNPDLTPRSVAVAHHISVSYLHRIFNDQGITIAAMIRHVKLEGACRDLANPALRNVAVQTIAARWGFASHSTFTRAFRAAYGILPRDYRQQEDMSTRTR